MGGHNSSRLALLLKLLLGAALLFLVLRSVDFSAVGGVRFAPLWLIPASLIGLFIIVLRAIRWKSVLASYFGHEMPLRDALPILFIGQLFGFATPGRAGDFVRAGYLRKSIGLKKGALSVALETLMDLAVMFVLSVCGLFMFRDAIRSTFEWDFPFSPLVLFLVVALAFVVVIYLVKASGYAGKLKEALKILRSSLSPAPLLSQLGLTMVKWTLASFVTYLCALSLGLKGAFIPFMLIMTLQSFLVMLPVTVFGLGIREGTSYLLYPFIGIPTDLALPLAWLSMFFLLLVPALIGVIAYFAYRGTVR